MKLYFALTTILCFILVHTLVIRADFFYEDFDKTLGLNMNGDAVTFGCKINETYSTYHEEITKRLNEAGYNETDLTTSNDVIGIGSISL